MVGIKGKSFTVADLAAAGVKRISLAGSLYRAAMSGLLDAAREVKDKGTFGYLDRALSTPDLNAFMGKRCTTLTEAALCGEDPPEGCVSPMTTC